MSKTATRPKAQPRADREWVSASEAGRRLESTPHRVRAWALAGLISAKCLPGQTPLYSAADIEKLRKEMCA